MLTFAAACTRIRPAKLVWRKPVHSNIYEIAERLRELMVEEVLYEHDLV